MRYRQLGSSDLQVPVISFGAWAIGGWLWGGSEDDAAIRAIHAAIDQGMNLIDTAPIYGMGHSETVVGRAIADRRDKVIIATKCGLRWDLAEGEKFFDTRDNSGTPRAIYKNLRPESIRWECEQSLRRLRVDHIDLYQCHWPDATTPLADTMAVLMDLKKEGKIRWIGVSNFTPAMMAECLRHGEIVSDQPEYSAIVRKIEKDVLPFCREHHIGILAYSPIAQGLLTGKVTPDREFPEGDLRRTKPLFSRENRIKVWNLLEKTRPIAERHNATLGQVFLAWLVAQPGMTTALAGARNEAQVVENAAAGSLILDDEEVRQIREWVEQDWPLV